MTEHELAVAILAFFKHMCVKYALAHSDDFKKWLHENYTDKTDEKEK